MHRDNIKVVLEFVGAHYATQVFIGGDRDVLDEFMSLVRVLFERIADEHQIAAHLLAHQNTIPKYQALRPDSQNLFNDLKLWVTKRKW